MQKFGLIMIGTLTQMYGAAFYLCSNDELKKTQSIQNARLSFQSSESGPPPSHPQGSVAPPPFGSKGETLRLRGRGWGT